VAGTAQKVAADGDRASRLAASAPGSGVDRELFIGIQSAIGTSCTLDDLAEVPDPEVPWMIPVA